MATGGGGRFRIRTGARPKVRNNSEAISSQNKAPAAPTLGSLWNQQRSVSERGGFSGIPSPTKQLSPSRRSGLTTWGAVPQQQGQTLRQGLFRQSSEGKIIGVTSPVKVRGSPEHAPALSTFQSPTRQPSPSRISGVTTWGAVPEQQGQTLRQGLFRQSIEGKNFGVTSPKKARGSPERAPALSIVSSPTRQPSPSRISGVTTWGAVPQQQGQTLRQGLFRQSSEGKNVGETSPGKRRGSSDHAPRQPSPSRTSGVTTWGAVAQQQGRTGTTAQGFFTGAQQPLVERSGSSRIPSPTRKQSPMRGGRVTTWGAVAQNPTQIPSEVMFRPRSQGLAELERSRRRRIPSLSRHPTPIRKAGLTNWGDIARQQRQIPAEELFRPRNQVVNASRVRDSFARATTKVPTPALRIQPGNATYPSTRNVGVIGSGILKIIINPNSLYSRPNFPRAQISRRHSEPPLISYPQTPSEGTLAFKDSLQSLRRAKPTSAYHSVVKLPFSDDFPLSEHNELPDQFISALHKSKTLSKSKGNTSISSLGDSLEPAYSRAGHASYRDRRFLSESLPSYHHLPRPHYTSTPSSFSISPGSQQILPHGSAIQSGSDLRFADSLDHGSSPHEIPSSYSRMLPPRYSSTRVERPLHPEHGAFPDQISSKLHKSLSPPKSRQNGTSFEDSLEPPYSRTGHASYRERRFLSESLPSFHHLPRPRFTSTPSSFSISPGSQQILRHPSATQSGSDLKLADSLDHGSTSHEIPSSYSQLSPPQYYSTPVEGQLYPEQDSAYLGFQHASPHAQLLNTTISKQSPQHMLDSRLLYDSQKDSHEGVSQPSIDHWPGASLSKTRMTYVFEDTPENYIRRPIINPHLLDLALSSQSSQHTLDSGLSYDPEEDSNEVSKYLSAPIEQESRDTFYSAANSNLNYHPLADTTDESFYSAQGSILHPHSSEYQSSLDETDDDSLPDDFYDHVFRDQTSSANFRRAVFDILRDESSIANFGRAQNNDYGDESLPTNIREEQSNYPTWISLERTGPSVDVEDEVPSHNIYPQRHSVSTDDSIAHQVLVYPEPISDESFQHYDDEPPDEQRDQHSVYTDDSIAHQVLVYPETASSVSSNETFQRNDDETPHEK